MSGFVEANNKRAEQGGVNSSFWRVAGWIVFLLLGVLPGSGSGDSHHFPRPKGYTYMPDKRPDVPWSIHIVKIDRSREDLTLHSVVGQYPNLGMATVSEQLKSLPPEWGPCSYAARPVATFRKSPSRGVACERFPGGSPWT